jgi:hypothetical protein
MSHDSLIDNRIKNRNDSFGYHYGRSENYCMSFSRNPKYITEKLLCNKLRKLLRIKVVLIITGIILVIPGLIAGILLVKHIMM